MEETAYFLSLVVKSDKPVVLVGSMRPATAISADGPINLYNAVALAGSAEAKGRGPLIVLNDTIHYAREAQKMHTTHMDTFASPNRGIAGVMNTGKATFYSLITTRHTTKSEFSLDGLTVENLPLVTVVYSYANMGELVIDAMAEKGVKGIVLAGVGDGNTTDAALAALERAARKGVAVVRCSRTGSGVVDRNVEVNDDKMGFIAGMELSAQKARILLMLGLTKTSDVKKLQEMFNQY
jgi:L-asparaginase